MSGGTALPAVTGADVGRPGNVEMGPVPHLADELRQEGGRARRSAPAPGRVPQVRVAAAHLVEELGPERQAPEALAGGVRGLEETR